MSSPFIIAIDGPSASGKGTIARKLASRLGFAHLDTGLLYRAVGAAMLRIGGDMGDAGLAEEAALALAKFMKNVPNGASLSHPIGGGKHAALASVDFNKLMEDEFLRSDQVSVAASKVAAAPGVRAALLKLQTDFCAAPPGDAKGAVLDGRDIGTVIAPQAQVKIFVTASAEARAERRFKELHQRGLPAVYADVLNDMKQRDARDSERAIAPTKPATEAVTVDTTSLTAAQALAEVLAIVRTRIDVERF